ncbi:hypothetical protein F5883DRAFT_645955 [Diaporthe sp. PMI_573]|nr:hypothetical protein F5883DRAFT_645955 [Diaporthaceae sp. PMI_573]
MELRFSGHDQSVVTPASLTSSLSGASPKTVRKPRNLTAEQVLQIEDIFTEALIDNQGRPEYSHAKSRKYAIHNIQKWKPHTAKITAIIDEFRDDKDAKQALRKLLALKQFGQFLAELNDGGQRQAFESLLEAYLKTHFPNNAFRIANTKKYLLADKACIIAARYIKPGETIENLGGWRVPLSDEELQDLVKEQKDFSVIDGTRYCRTSLLAGPVYLINHSCNHNAEMQVMGGRFEVKVVTRRHIFKGEEITVSYGSDYFGNKNQDC